MDAAHRSQTVLTYLAGIPPLIVPAAEVATAEARESNDVV